MSLWSGPHMARFGGYSEHFLMLLALATAEARRWFPRLILYADEPAASLLEDFPFDEIRVKLGKHTTPKAERVWAAGKIFTYADLAEQGEAFCHIDGDVILVKEPHVLAAGVFAQSAEPFSSPPRFKWEENPHDHTLIGVYLNQRAATLNYLPPAVRFSLTRREHKPYNVGIFGGNNLDFIGRYARQSLKTLNHPLNQDILEHCIPVCASCFIEQYFLGAQAQSENQYVATMFPDESIRNELLMKEIGYIHLLGDSKRDNVIVERVYAKIAREFPWLYEIVKAMKLPRYLLSNEERAYCYTY